MKIELKKSLFLCLFISFLIILITQLNLFEYAKHSTVFGDSPQDSVDPIKEFDENDINNDIYNQEVMVLNHIYYKSRGLDKVKEETEEPKQFKDKLEQTRFTRMKFIEIRKRHKLNKENDRIVRNYLFSEYNNQSLLVLGRDGKEILPSLLNANVIPLDLKLNQSLIDGDDKQLWKKDPNLNPLLLKFPILFIHNPKTAGTTLKKIILKNVDISRYYHKDVHPSFDDAPVLIESTFLFGHMRMGLHYYFERYYSNYPLNKTENTIDKYIEDREDKMNPYSYLAIVRDPVERVYSHYYFLKESITHPLHSQTMKLTFQSWIQRSPIAHNEMCRRFVGLAREDHIPGDFREQCLFRLKHTFKFIGLTERFNETLVLLTHYLGFTDISYKSENIGSLKNRFALSKDDRTLISMYNEIDIEMYNEAKILFEKQIDQVGRDYFLEELKRFNENKS